MLQYRPAANMKARFAEAAEGGARLTPEARSVVEIVILKLMLVLRNYLFEEASQAILGVGAYRRIV